MKISTGKIVLSTYADDADEFGCFHLTKIVASAMKIEYSAALQLMADGKVEVEGIKIKEPIGLFLAGRTLKIDGKKWKIEGTA
jgi:hypothetical protein